MSVLHTPEKSTGLSFKFPEVAQKNANLSFIQRQSKNLLARCFKQFKQDCLILHDLEGTQSFGEKSDSRMNASIAVNNPRAYSKFVWGGSIAAAEAYLRGYWESDDLVQLMRILIRQQEFFPQIENFGARYMRPFRNFLHALRKNTKAGAKKNISAHYDLSNEFFSLMLDSTMTYSSGIFQDESVSMEAASFAKYERICQSIHLTSEDHVLEIGTGWGGFALYAAKTYGVKVTTTTISQQQYEYAQQQIQAAGLEDQITLLQQDYRDLKGTFDKLVSIEMIEAVGENYLDCFFAQCSKLLAPHGLMALQSITMPDHNYDAYRNSVDFINLYIFPGGFLPSISRIGQSLKDHTDLRMIQLTDFAQDYALTLERWREQFWENIEQVKELGFDERFIRTWHYYLCFCEAGFREREIGLSQIVLSKPKYHQHAS